MTKLKELTFMEVVQMANEFEMGRSNKFDVILVDVSDYNDSIIKTFREKILEAEEINDGIETSCLQTGINSYIQTSKLRVYRGHLYEGFNTMNSLDIILRGLFFIEIED